MELPELLPEPMEPELEPDPVALGELPLEDGELEDEPLPEAPEDELPVEPLVDEPEVPPLLELDEPKCLSHSEREIWPSLLVSTDEKLGCDELLALPPDVPPAPALLDELPMLPLDELPPLAEGDEDDELPLADGEDDELLPCLEESAAAAANDKAKSAAAVVTVTVLSI